MTPEADNRPSGGSPDLATGKSIEPRSWRVIAVNFAWLNGERAVDMAITLFVTVLVARYLGPERFGILGYLIGLTALFASVAPLGTHRLLVLEFVRRPQDADRLLGTSTVLKLCGGLGAAVCILVAVPALSPGLDGALLFGCLFAATTIAAALNGPELLFSAHTQSRYSVLSSTIVRAAMAVARLTLVYLAATLAAFVTATALESVLIIVALLMVYRLQGGDVARWRFDGALARNLLRRGLPLMLASVATAILMRLGVVMVEQFAGGDAAGIYVSATRISDTCGLLAGNLIISISPTLISIRAESMARYMETIARLMQGVCVGMSIVALGLCVVSHQLIQILLGAAFADAAGVLRIYVWSNLFIALGLIQTQWLINEGYENFVLVRSIAGGITNFAANLLLIPRYGAQGAAYAALIAQATSCILINLLGDARTRRIFMLQLKALAWLNLRLLLSRRAARTET